MSVWQVFRSKSKNRAHSDKPVSRVASTQSVSYDDTEGLKFKGFTEGRTPTPFVDLLPDEQLEELNGILKWNCFTVDSSGRRFGQIHSVKKRQVPQTVPDNRILMMDSKFNLADKSVLEFGCFEGVHTIALAQRAKRVVAVDSRIENVVKTMVRLGFFRQHAEVMCANIEALTPEANSFMKCDLAHHVGVLYHLKDPVGHIHQMKEFAPLGLMLDTHYATEEMAIESYAAKGGTFKYHKHDEPAGYRGVFAGMYDHAKWLTIQGLKKALNDAGYSHVEIVEERQERNGPRLLLFAHSMQ